MTEARTPTKQARPTVFLTFSQKDRMVAQLLQLKLRDAGVNAWSDEHFDYGADWKLALDARLRTSDYVLLLVSQAALNSSYFREEYATALMLREFSDRSITVIPILLEDVDLPPALSTIQHLNFSSDLQSGVDDLVARLSASIDIDFATLSFQDFENLVADLLDDIGFSIEREPTVDGFHFDFAATYPSTDPFGGPTDNRWLIEVKHRSSGRVTVETIRQVASTWHSLRDRSSFAQMALITSGQITSAARELINSAPIRLIEGVELRRILLTRPHLIRKYLRSVRP